MPTRSVASALKPTTNTDPANRGGAVMMAASDANAAPAAVIADDEPTKQNVVIPRAFNAPFGSYPNLLKITQAERDSFSPVVFFPETMPKEGQRNNNTNDSLVIIKDHRQSSGELASPEQIHELRIHKRKNVLQKILRKNNNNYYSGDHRPWSQCWGIGKYDENRDGGMYDSDLFDDLANTIDGYGGRRTVHLGMDLGGPVGTPVHAFCDGRVHSVGYNSALGDYGHVLVIEHTWESMEGEGKAVKRCWALYGHLDESALTAIAIDNDDDDGTDRVWRKWLPLDKKPTTKLVKPGDLVKRGQMIGRMGGIDENGGWLHSHLHFQLSTKPPDQPHDMPGASSVKDRAEALLQYPDPRYVLGPMY